MSSNLPAARKPSQLEDAEDTEDLVTMSVAGQLIGLPATEIQDVHINQQITKVPLAPPEVSGLLNLRGRIVTAIDLRQRLKLPSHGAAKDKTAVVVRYHEDMYALLVDEIGDVLRVNRSKIDKNPSTMQAAWAQISDGIVQLKGKLLIISNVRKLLGAYARSAN